LSDYLDKMIAYNRVFVNHELYKKYQTNKYPERKAAILTCMDTRLTELLPAALGLKNGDVKMIKNAGGQITHSYGSVMFSIIVAIYELGVNSILVVGHDDCGIQKLEGKEIIEKMVAMGIKRETIVRVSEEEKDVEKWLTGFHDVCISVEKTMEIIRNHPLVHDKVDIQGYIMNPETGAIRSLEEAKK